MTTISPALVLLYLLEAAGLLTRASNKDVWPASTGLLPDAPDNAIALTNYGSALDGRLMASGEQIEHPLVQVRIRATNDIDAYAKGRAIEIAMMSIKNTQVTCPGGPVNVQCVVRETPMMYMGVEEKNRRASYSLNFKVSFIPGA